MDDKFPIVTKDDMIAYLENEHQVALARAEDAENVLRLIRWHMEPHDPRMATEDDIIEHMREFSQTYEAMHEMQDRVAELEAQLAALKWRPVTEPPESPGDYLVYTWPGECEVVMFDSDGYWQTTPVTHWQPLPAPPIDPPAPA